MNKFEEFLHDYGFLILFLIALFMFYGLIYGVFHFSEKYYEDDPFYSERNETVESLISEYLHVSSDQFLVSPTLGKKVPDHYNVTYGAKEYHVEFEVNDSSIPFKIVKFVETK